MTKVKITPNHMEVQIRRDGSQTVEEDQRADQINNMWKAFYPKMLTLRNNLLPSPV